MVWEDELDILMRSGYPEIIHDFVIRVDVAASKNLRLDFSPSKVRTKQSLCSENL